MIFIIRGHIRDAFKVQHLYNLIKETYTIYPDLKIFIHTWNIFENNISWKIRRVNNTIVNEEVIKEYFGDLMNNILFD